MATYNIQHITRYTYDEIVPVCHNLAHLLPRQSERHEWEFAHVDISPTPAIRSERIDYFGNRLLFFAVQEPHTRLEVTARSQVDVIPRAELPSTSPPWEQVRDSLLAGNPDLLDPLQFTFASPSIQWTDEVRAYAEESFPPGRPIIDALLDLTRRIHHDFTYDTRTTTITTTLPEILRTRSGVCQDFAHLQIGCLRSLGLGARYVSGYLLTTPPPGQPRLLGADASHAWLSVYVPGAGWVDVDPTNDVVVSEKHIVIAWGRDFADVSPLRGVILGGGRHQVAVSVDVAPLA